MWWAVATSGPGKEAEDAQAAARIGSWCHRREERAVSWEGRREGPGLSPGRARFWGQQHERKAWKEMDSSLPSQATSSVPVTLCAKEDELEGLGGSRAELCLI